MSDWIGRVRYDIAGSRYIDWRDYHAAFNGWTNEQERIREEHRQARVRAVGDPVRSMLPRSAD